VIEMRTVEVVSSVSFAYGNLAAELEAVGAQQSCTFNRCRCYSCSDVCYCN
jgi:hypothetical protein